MSTAPRLSFPAFNDLAPQVVAGLRALTKVVDDSGLEKSTTELIKVRASQLNGCAFCLQFHLNLARQQGISPEKLDLLATWPEAGVFTAREQAALAWTEILTREPARAATDDAYQAVRAQFSESEIVFLTVAVGTINQWNRIAVALRFAPPIPARATAA